MEMPMMKSVSYVLKYRREQKFAATLYAIMVKIFQIRVQRNLPRRCAHTSLVDFMGVGGHVSSHDILSSTRFLVWLDNISLNELW